MPSVKDKMDVFRRGAERPRQLPKRGTLQGLDIRPYRVSKEAIEEGSGRKLPKHKNGNGGKKNGR